jgi:hypothetical protein
MIEPRNTSTRLFLLLTALVILAAGCSTSRLATRAMVPVLENTREFALSSPSVETFTASLPSNLYLLEGLIATDPSNEKLRVNASMLYFSYAFAAVEDEDPAYASYLYHRGFMHGRAALLHGVKRADRWSGDTSEFSAMAGRFTVRDVPALAWTAANWAQYINLNLDSVTAIADIPRVVILLERACSLDGGYFEGLPYMMLGSIHAFRPPMMGGDPKASKENFERAFSISGGKFLLAKYFFARYYCYRIQDAELFSNTLTRILKEPDDLLPRYRLLNAIAKLRAERLLEEKDELF